ncbi:lipid storage droplets surface-binding protein 2 [Microplitis demolitor]|uniref:lipid storage droplets surface-binding protein 2 n=1 Tax=Microplitis demolitor TaxID=69319 RepID=UPI00235B6A04|nr:lipid storage droplets surface-binding protein 2 [Microplitis demolitor]
MTDQVQSPSGGPHLEVLDRVKNIPAVHMAIEKTGSTYSYLKGSHQLINWALSYAEAGLHYATATAAPIAVPLAKKFEGQINTVDQKLCKGLDIVVQTVPIFNQPTQEIYDAARNVMNSSLQPTIDKLLAAKESATHQANVIKKISVDKANELLNNHYGDLAVQSIDNTNVLVNKLIDYYFPPIEEEDTQTAPVSADENKVLHAVQTIGQLSSKTANRIFHSVSAQLKTIQREDVATYISSVVSILHLTHFLNLAKEISNPTISSDNTN